MADLTITVGSVIKGSGALSERRAAGATITAGVPLYLDTDNTVKPADANDTLAKSQVVGIAEHAALTGQPCSYVTSGPIAIGATVVQDMVYCVSASVGLICPISDIASGNFCSVIGRATSTTVITVDINNATAAIGADVV